MLGQINRLQAGVVELQDLADSLMPNAKPVIHPPFMCAKGSDVYAGADLVIYSNVDLGDNTDIYLGDQVRLGCDVSIATIDHPLLPLQRLLDIVRAKEVRIGSNVIIGSGVSLLPGCTIGDNVWIKEGSVVTSNIPAGYKAAGRPCRRGVRLTAAEIEGDEEVFRAWSKLDQSNKLPMNPSKRSLAFNNMIFSGEDQQRSYLTSVLTQLPPDHDVLALQPFLFSNGAHIRFSGTDSIFINNGCRFYDTDPDKPIVLNSGVFLGPKVELQPGVTIGKEISGQVIITGFRGSPHI